ncbi:MAG: N-acetyltransferase family protein [Corynebacterium pyruviciproducens]|uniref:GNAT family N-acetyltransferase n=1 Tax=Corynebacterium pyruviciproducens TaxID=598660 RepID=UPI0024570B78|nr:N-acetyltransferase [Corynebacterium pyruviciproducens]MDH4658021.1 GNAT family N-acetyltransferase [Corynebacterium pyruviciproducens]
MTDTHIDIRPATVQDVDALQRLSIDTFTETFGHLYRPEDLAEFLTTTYSTPALTELLASPRHHTWLAEDGGSAIGYVLVGPCGLPHPDVAERDGEIKRLYLRGDYQNSGTGSTLMRLGVDWLDAHCPTVWLGVWSQNFAAQRFYRRFGFDKAGEYRFKVGEHYDHEFIFRKG